MARVKELIRLG